MHPRQYFQECVGELLACVLVQQVNRYGQDNQGQSCGQVREGNGDQHSGGLAMSANISCRAFKTQQRC